MEKYCAYCRYLNINDVKDGQSYCKEKKERRFANSTSSQDCSDSFRIPWGYERQADEAIKRAEEYQKEHREYKSVGCFITTVVVDMLGLDDNCSDLQILRKFRAVYLQTDPQYANLLLKYDAIGPVLASALVTDENGMQFAIDLYTIFIRGCVKYIKKGQIENAVLLYTEMVEAMIKKYGVETFIPDGFEDKYDAQNGGHGRSMVLK